MQQFLTKVVENPEIEIKYTLVQLINAIVASQHHVMRVTTSVQLTTVVIEDTVEDVVEDKIVEGTIFLTQPMVMATMTIIVEGMTTVMTVVKTIAITLIIMTTTNLIVSKVILIRDLVAQAERQEVQVVHTLEDMNALNTLHPLITIMWSLTMKSKLTHSTLIMTNARCQQKQHLEKHLATHVIARALAKPQARQLSLIVRGLNLLTRK